VTVLSADVTWCGWRFQTREVAIGKSRSDVDSWQRTIGECCVSVI